MSGSKLKTVHVLLMSTFIWQRDDPDSETQNRPGESQVDCSTGTFANGNSRIPDPNRTSRDWEQGSSCYPMQSPLWSPVHSSFRDSSGRFEVSKPVVIALPYKSAHEKHMHGFPTSCSTWQISIRNGAIALPHKNPLRKPMHFWFRKGARAISLSYKKPRRKHVHSQFLTRFAVLLTQL